LVQVVEQYIIQIDFLQFIDMASVPTLIKVIAASAGASFVSMCIGSIFGEGEKQSKKKKSKK